MRVLILFSILIPLSAQAQGKPPEYWCRAESEKTGQSYLDFGLSLDHACASALRLCKENRNDDCIVESYGEF